MTRPDPADRSATRFTFLTPAGAAAIATVAITGPHAWEVLRALFHSRSSLPENPAAGSMWHGYFGDDVRDEVVVTVKHTYPRFWVEVHSHGGAAVRRMMEESLIRAGLAAVPWQTLVHDTEASLLRAEALCALVQAPTLRTARILLAQYHGAFERALEEFFQAHKQGESPRALSILDLCYKHVRLGRHLTTPWSVVIGGAVNVGKSSLMNALAGYQRAIVSALPGTTRDIVTATLAFDGWPVNLADTAGIRDAETPIEQAGMARALQEQRGADLCLWVMDGSAEPVWPTEILDNPIYVINKTDLDPAWDFSQIPANHRVSARTGTGIATLCRVIAERLVASAPGPDDPVPFTPALCAGMEQAWLCGHAGDLDQAASILESLARGEHCHAALQGS